MIASQHRFHGYRSLSAVYRHGTTVRNQSLALKYIRSPRQTTYRAAVIVSRKVHKSAVKRNRVRRRLYEIIRLQGDQITEPYDMVLSVFSDQIIDTPPAELDRMVRRLLTKAGIIGRKPAGKASAQPHGIVKAKEDNL